MRCLAISHVSSFGSCYTLRRMNFMSSKAKTKVADTLAPTLKAVRDAANALIAVAVVAVAALVLSIIALARTRRTA